MTVTVEAATQSSVTDVARRAREASRVLVRCSADARRAGLFAMAAALEDHVDAIVAANLLDLAAGETAGLSAPMLDRLRLDAAGEDLCPTMNTHTRRIFRFLLCRDLFSK